MFVKVFFFFFRIFSEKIHKVKQISKLEVKCLTLSLNGSVFESTTINEISSSNCSTNYSVFDSTSPYFPIPNEKGEAICILNNDNATADWNVIKSCEPLCSTREGGCDHQQICAKSIGETIEKCICVGYIGKYCETIDPRGFFSFFHFFSFSFI